MYLQNSLGEKFCSSDLYAYADPKVGNIFLKPTLKVRKFTYKILSERSSVHQIYMHMLRKEWDLIHSSVTLAAMRNFLRGLLLFLIYGVTVGSFRGIDDFVL